MSQQLISRSPDLLRLRDEGYAIEIKSNFLLLNDVPYVTQGLEVAYGILVSDLTLAGDIATTPQNHTVTFTGEVPCDAAGRPLNIIASKNIHREITPGLTVNHEFSRKPNEGYRDYYDKMTTYVALISGPAEALDPSATAQTRRVIENTGGGSVFRYAETASSRAGIAGLTEKLACEPIAIIGMGGTGGYILDYLAKTPVREIHLFDEDLFLQHNAFRAPGAASLEKLKTKPTKSAYFREMYSEMRDKIFAHSHLNESTAYELQGMAFAFVAVDDGPSRRFAVKTLRDFGVEFIDVGMGVLEVQDADGSLMGQLRTTLCTAEVHPEIPYDQGANNDYSKNIQIAELNALNAALAVIKWKKRRGFYADIKGEHESYYQIDGNHLINEAIS